MLALILKRDQWPSRLEFDAALSTWREFRADFAEASMASEWALVDNFYASLARVVPTVEPGTPLTDQDRSGIEELLAMLPEVQRIAAARAVSSENERRRVTEVLSAAG